MNPHPAGLAYKYAMDSVTSQLRPVAPSRFHCLSLAAIVCRGRLSHTGRAVYLLLAIEHLSLGLVKSCIGAKMRDKLCCLDNYNILGA